MWQAYFVFFQNIETFKYFAYSSYKPVKHQNVPKYIFLVALLEKRFDTFWVVIRAYG